MKQSRKILLIGTLLLAVVLAASGCARGKVMLTGQKRTPIPKEEVRVYSEIPSGAEEIGIVMVESGGKGQKALNSAIDKAKEKAPEIGANGIVPHQVGKTTTFYNWFPVDETTMTMRAIWAWR